VCHTNYQEEEMVTQHAVENVGCVKCHGDSLAHRNDENNTTPPDKMYPLTSIDRACMECHETHDAPARKVLARWRERCPAKNDPTLIVCTDCHGEHRLKHRTVRWDKATGKLLMEPQDPAKPAAKNGNKGAKPEAKPKS
jgi:formate-dependent nitrite reductase cytochrome c552 subunit